MSTLATADLHLNSNPRDEYRFVFFEKGLFSLLKNTRSNRLLILGDLTHEKDNHSAELVNRITNGLAQLQRYCEVYVLNGNHDGYNPDLPFFKFTEHLKDLYWINDPGEYTLPDLGRCQFLPHTRNHKKAWPTPFRDDLDWIFAHNTFDGADAGGGRRLKGIDPKVFPRNVRIVSGDVHIPQDLGPITYVGAPYTVNFGDAYKPRVMQLARDPRGHTQDQSIPVEGPQKVLIEIPSNVNETKLNKLAAKIYKDDIVKIKVHLNADAYSNWQNVHDKVRKWAEELGAIVHAIVPVKASKTLKIRSTVTANRHGDDPALIREFAKRNHTPPDVLKTGLWLMEQK